MDHVLTACDWAAWGRTVRKKSGWSGAKCINEDDNNKKEEKTNKKDKTAVGIASGIPHPKAVCSLTRSNSHLRFLGMSFVYMSVTFLAQIPYTMFW